LLLQINIPKNVQVFWLTFISSFLLFGDLRSICDVSLSAMADEVDAFGSEVKIAKLLHILLHAGCESILALASI
jgi:hypothetical protein